MDEDSIHVWVYTCVYWCVPDSGHQPSESELGKSPRFLAAVLGGTPPFGLNSECSPVLTLSTNMAAPVMRFIVFVIVPRWFIFM